MLGLERPHARNDAPWAVAFFPGFSEFQRSDLDLHCFDEFGSVRVRHGLFVSIVRTLLLCASWRQ